ncbi:MAG: C4-type zinc ribbon domain-containing protein [Endomicrobium sp.]|jgi:predicted  nucleic acid-binding Zn-ribbon protein|nr:C4-type zinc ribbon domain-containing protein [Endomicrobium sp.]
MESLKYDFELLYKLQNYDTKIDDIKSKINRILLSVIEKKGILENKKFELDFEKKKYRELVSSKKEKEALLYSKEKLISKYSMELNVVRSNDVYKVLLLEIKKAKADKSVVEDEILWLMDEVDRESLVCRFIESEFKKNELKVASEISEIERSVKFFEKEIIGIEIERKEFGLSINKKVLEQYERLREGRSGQNICLVDGDSCSGCGIVLRPQLINQTEKCHDLVFCDNCSRILLKK